MEELRQTLKDKKPPKISFELDRTVRRITIHFLDTRVSEIRFSQHLAYMLGLDSATIYRREAIDSSSGFEKDLGYVMARFPPDMRGGVDSLYLYTNIVENQIVGNTLAPLLQIIPVSGEHGEVIQKTIYSPHYVPVLTNKFSSIEVNLKNDQDDNLPFLFGKVVVKLHFRRRKKRFF